MFPCVDFITLNPDYAKLQAAVGSMAQVNQWFVYHLTPKPDQPGKYIKIPCPPTGPVWDPEREAWKGISLTDPRNWMAMNYAFQAVVRLEQTKINPNDRFTLGFALTEHDPYFFIDLDFENLTDIERWGQLTVWREKFPHALVETSSSGRGFHIIARYSAKIPAHSNKSDDVELYSQGRGIAFGFSMGTVSGSADTDLTGQLLHLIDQRFNVIEHEVVSAELTQAPVPGYAGFKDNAALLMFLTAHDPARKHKAAIMFGGMDPSALGTVSFLDLWQLNREALSQCPQYVKPDGTLDHSQIDNDVAKWLCWATGNHTQRVYDIMMSNPYLMRKKWTSRRFLRDVTGKRIAGNYLMLTIARAASRTHRFYKVNDAKASPLALPGSNPPAGDSSSSSMLSIPGAGTASVAPHEVNVPALPLKASVPVTLPPQTVIEYPELAVSDQLVIPGSSGDAAPKVETEEDKKEKERQVVQQIAQCQDEEQLIIAIAHYLKLGRLTTIRTSKLIAVVTMVCKRFMDSVPNRSGIMLLVREAAVLVVNATPEYQVIIDDISRWWVYRYDADRYTMIDGRADKLYMPQGVARYIDRVLEARDPLGLLKRAYPDTIEFLQNRCSIPQVVEALFVPLPPHIGNVPVVSATNRTSVEALFRLHRDMAKQEHDEPMVAFVNTALRTISRNPGGFINMYNSSSIPDMIEPDQEMIRRYTRWKRQCLRPMCGNRPEVAEAILWFMRHNIRYPGLKIRWSPLITGPQRSGKSTIFTLMSAALGNDNCSPVNTGSMNGQFNSFAAGSVLVGIEELYISGAKRFEIANSLKTLISEDVISVERKRQDPIKADNCTNYIAFSNKDAPIPLEDGDGRWFVIQLPANTEYEVYEMLGVGTAAAKTELFNDVYKMTESEESRGMLRHLLHHEVIEGEFVRHRLPFQTEEKERLRINAGSRHTLALAEMIEAGRYPLINDDFVVSWSLQKAWLCEEGEGAGLPKYTSRSIGHALKDLGYHYNRRVRLTDESRTLVYGKTKEGLNHAAATLLNDPTQMFKLTTN